MQSIEPDRPYSGHIHWWCARVNENTRHAKRQRFINSIDSIFAAMDSNDDGWVTKEDFAEVVRTPCAYRVICSISVAVDAMQVDSRKRRAEGGNDAQVFFHTILAQYPVTPSLVDEMYRAIGGKLTAAPPRRPPQASPNSSSPAAYCV
jgi:hypothetical protein